MADQSEAPVDRSGWRTERAALIQAAQACIAEGQLDVPVLEIAQAADVGMDTFHDHFDSKQALFDAAVAEALDAHGALMDQLTASLDDPVEKFACSFRLTGRLFRQRPIEGLVLLVNGLNVVAADNGLAPRAARDIAEAVEAGRFQVGDPKLAMAVAAGALMGLQDELPRDDALAADQMTENVLRVFGLSAEDARDICQRPLPDIDGLTRPDSEGSNISPESR
jgi:AcrR family transcriptional regulator